MEVGIGERVTGGGVGFDSGVDVRRKMSPKSRLLARCAAAVNFPTSFLVSFEPSRCRIVKAAGTIVIEPRFALKSPPPPSAGNDGSSDDLIDDKEPIVFSSEIRDVRSDVLDSVGRRDRTDDDGFLTIAGSSFVVRPPPLDGGASVFSLAGGLSGGGGGSDGGGGNEIGGTSTSSSVLSRRISTTTFPMASFIA